MQFIHTRHNRCMAFGRVIHRTGGWLLHDDARYDRYVFARVELSGEPL